MKNKVMLKLIEDVAYERRRVTRREAEITELRDALAVSEGVAMEYAEQCAGGFDQLNGLIDRQNATIKANQRGIESQRAHIQSLKDQIKVTSSRADSYARKVVRAYTALIDTTDSRTAVRWALAALNEIHSVDDNGVVQVPTGPAVRTNCRCSTAPILGRPIVKEGRGGKNPAPTQETSVPEPRVELYPVYPPARNGNPVWMKMADDHDKQCGCKNPASDARNERS